MNAVEIGQIAIIALGSGLSFHLRGIWGHQLGGAVNGAILGWIFGLVFDLKLEVSLNLAFWLGIAGVLSSMVGWANYEGKNRFFRGYLGHGIPPNLVLYFILFPDSPIIGLWLIFLGSFGMGLGFGLSSPLLRYFRTQIRNDYRQKTGKELKFNEIKLESQISHVYAIRFNTWTYLMEFPSGILYGLTTGFVLSIFSGEIDPNYVEARWFIFFVAIVFVGIVFPLLFAGGYRRKGQRNPFVSIPENIDDIKKKVNQKNRWSPKRVKMFKKWTWIAFVGISVPYQIYIFEIPLEFQFCVWLWTIAISGRLCHELDSAMFQIDMFFDFVLCALLCIALK